MRMQRLYYEFDSEDRKVYNTWLRRTFLLWGSILLAGVVVCTVLEREASTTSEQRIAPLQQSVSMND
jgi:hypothetical protein